jgi:hypothetical protein
MWGSRDSRGFDEYPKHLDPKMFDQRELSSDHYIGKIKAGQTQAPQDPKTAKKFANLNSRINDFMTKNKTKFTLNSGKKLACDLHRSKDLCHPHPNSEKTNLNPKIPNHYDFKPKVKYRTRASAKNPKNPKNPQKSPKNSNQKIISINSPKNPKGS